MFAPASNMNRDSPKDTWTEPTASSISAKNSEASGEGTYFDPRLPYLCLIIFFHCVVSPPPPPPPPVLRPLTISAPPAAPQALLSQTCSGPRQQFSMGLDSSAAAPCTAAGLSLLPPTSCLAGSLPPPPPSSPVVEAKAGCACRLPSVHPRRRRRWWCRGGSLRRGERGGGSPPLSSRQTPLPQSE